MVNTIPTSLFVSSWRFFKKHPWQLWMTLLSIALGSAVMIAVDLANNSARDSFTESVQTISGRMTHRIVSSNKHGIEEQFYTHLRTKLGYRKSAPIVEGDLIIQGEQYQLIGIDIFAEPLFSGGKAGSEDDFSVKTNTFMQLLVKPNSVIVAHNSGERLGMQIDQPFELSVNGKRQSINPIGFFPEAQNAALDNFLLTDISTAQEILEKFGSLDRIDLILNDDEASQLSANLSTRTPEDLTLKTLQNEKNALQQMTAAFRTNLTAMSLLAMLVGAFLVYNTMTFSVLQRRQQFAVERMLGVTGGQIFLHILIEAMVLGLIGSLLGIVLGVFLGQGLLVLITRTINDLYTAVDLNVLLLQPMLIIKGIGIALLTVFIATLAPAWEAAKVQPAIVNRSSELELHFNRLMPWLVIIGLFLVILSGVLLLSFERSLFGGFVALFLMVIGYSLWIPLFVSLLLRLFSSKNANLLWSMATRGIQASLSRTNLAIIALAIAVSATVGVGIMITSFRSTVSDWLETTLQSDIFISANRNSSSSERGKLDEFWLEEIRQLSSIESISTGRTSKVTVDGVPTPVFVLNPGQHGHTGFKLLQGNLETAWKRYLTGEVVLVSEPFAYHHKLSVGDHFQLTGDANQNLNFEIGAIYQDYSATQGMLVMPPALYHKHWDDHSISSIGLMLEDGVNIKDVREQLSLMAKRSSGAVKIRSNKEVRDISLEVFDRTFAITNVLKLLVILVAFVGVFSALMALFIEKGREFAVLRATGLTPQQLTKMVLLQTGIIGLLAGLLALPLGWAMSEILINVINQRSFGWTMSRSFPPIIIVQALLLSIGAALLAGLYPVRRISQISISQGLRR